METSTIMINGQLVEIEVRSFEDQPKTGEQSWGYFWEFVGVVPVKLGGADVDEVIPLPANWPQYQVEELVVE
jgi:hypothetical protein